MVGIILTITVAVIAGLAGIVKIAEYLQTNAKAHSDVESLQREMADLMKRMDSLEREVNHLKKDNTSLIEHSQELARQNGELIQLLQGDDSPEEEE